MLLLRSFGKPQDRSTVCNLTAPACIHFHCADGLYTQTLAYRPDKWSNGARMTYRMPEYGIHRMLSLKLIPPCHGQTDRDLLL